MQKTKIEWVKNKDGTQGYTINPMKGLCPVDCKDNQGKSYCYARRMHKRFKWNPEIRYESKAFIGLANLKKPSRIFVGSTIELFGDWVEHWWLEDIFMIVQAYPQHTFIFLTKQPQNLIKWSPFPENCWVGVTATDDKMFNKAIVNLQQVKAKVKYISFEPLLGQIGLIHYLPLMLLESINWVIIGQQTPSKSFTRPKPEWIQEIINAADKANIPLFIKNNILDDWDSHWLSRWNRQEFPK